MAAQLTRQTMAASYNGFVFDPVTTKTTHIRIKPQRSGDGRTVLYHTWNVGLKCEIVAANGTTDAAVASALVLLTHAGGRFYYRGRGLGNPDINTGAVTDLKYGPWPNVVSIELTGAGNAVTLTWEVEFTIPHCPGGFNPFGPMEVSIGVQHAVDDAGYVTRSVSGYLVVPNNFTYVNGKKQSIQSADQYRDRILTDLPPNFRRHGQLFRVGQDQSRLDFSWTDEEMPVALPPGVVEATWDDGVDSTNAGLAVWGGSISASYRVAKGYTFLDAATAFFTTLEQVLTDRNKRLGIVAKPPPNAGGGLVQSVLQPKVKVQPHVHPVIPSGFSMRNTNRYGKGSFQFAFRYRIGCPLSDLLTATGLYLPFAHDWRLWRASVANTALNPYGAANLTWLPQDDPGIVDTCNPLLQQRVLRGGFFPPPIPLPNPQPDGGGAGGAGELSTNAGVQRMVRDTFPTPQPEQSWVEYENGFFVEADTGIVHTKKLPKRVPDANAGVFAANGVGAEGASPLDDLRGLAPPGFVVGPGVRVERQDTPKGIMRRVDESCVIYLRGMAIRAGHPILPPRLVAVNGVGAVPDCRPDRGEGFGVGVLGNGVNPLNYAYWNLRYVLDRVPPGPLPTPPNPTLDKQ